MTQARRATDSGEPTNAEVQYALERRLTLIEKAIEGQGIKLDGWITNHTELHRMEEREFQAHLRDAVTRDSEIKSLEGLTPDVRAAHDLNVRLDTLVGFISRVQWLALAAFLVSLAALIVEAFVGHPVAPVLK